MSTTGEYISTETSVLRRQTVQLLQIEGYPISLHRPALRALTEAGGVAGTGPETVFDPVTRYVGQQGREQWDTLPGEGSGPKLKQYLLGPYGDNIQQGDWFFDPKSGRKYTVLYVHEDQTVEVRAELEVMM